MWRLTDEQRELREHIRTVVLDEIRPRVREIDERCDYPHDVTDARARGPPRPAVPHEHGGRGESDVSFCAYVEELAKISATVSLMAAYVKLVALPIILAGSEEQKNDWLPRPASRRDPRLLRAHRARRRLGPGRARDPAESIDDGWRINGAEALHRQRGHAQVYVVFARTGDEGPGASARSSSPATPPASASSRCATMGMPGWKLGAPSSRTSRCRRRRTCSAARATASRSR